MEGFDDDNAGDDVNEDDDEWMLLSFEIRDDEW